MPDELQFICAECGKRFDPDPDTMLESVLSPVLLPEGEATREIEEGLALSAKELVEADSQDLEQLGITAEQRDALLRGEQVSAGGICICKACQDRLAADEERKN